MKGCQVLPSPTVEPAIISVLAQVGALGGSRRTLHCTGTYLAAGAGAVLLFRGQTVTPAIMHHWETLPCLRGWYSHGCQHLLWAPGLTGARATKPLPHPALLPAAFLLLSWGLAGPCVRLRAAGCGCVGAGAEFGAHWAGGEQPGANAEPLQRLCPTSPSLPEHPQEESAPSRKTWR